MFLKVVIQIRHLQANKFSGWNMPMCDVYRKVKWGTRRIDHVRVYIYTARTSGWTWQELQNETASANSFANMEDERLGWCCSNIKKRFSWPTALLLIIYLNILIKSGFTLRCCSGRVGVLEARTTPLLCSRIIPKEFQCFYCVLNEPGWPKISTWSPEWHNPIGFSGLIAFWGSTLPDSERLNHVYKVRFIIDIPTKSYWDEIESREHCHLLRLRPNPLSTWTRSPVSGHGCLASFFFCSIQSLFIYRCVNFTQVYV